MLDILSSLEVNGLECLVQHILSYLDQTDLHCCQLVNRAWHEHVREMWRHFEHRLLWHSQLQPSISVIQCTRERSVCTVSSLVLDERHLCVALSSSGRVELYERRFPHNQVWSVIGHTDGVYGLDMNNVSVVSGGDDGDNEHKFAINIFSRLDGLLQHQLLYHDYIVWEIKIRLDLIISCSHDCSICVFQIHSSDDEVNCPTLLRRLRGPTSWGDAVAMDEKAERLVTFDENNFDVLVWNIDTYDDCSKDEASREIDLRLRETSLCLRGHESELQCVKLRSNLVFTADSVGVMRVWDGVEGACIRVLHSKLDKVWCIDVDNRRIVVAGRHGRIRLWPLEVAFSDNQQDEWEQQGRWINGHEMSTAIGKIHLDRAMLVSADGLGRVLLHDFWQPEPRPPKLA